MKRSGLINLICSLIAAVVLIIGALMVLVFNDVITVEKEELVISSPSAIATYNGKALTDNGWRLIEGELKDGHRLSVNVTGSQTGVGISENHISAVVLDKSGVDVSDEYNIVYKPGALNVKARSITVVAESAMKVYDGTPLVCDEYYVESAFSLVEGDVLTATVVGSLTEIGEADNDVSNVVILDSKGANVTRNYNIKPVKGKLIVHSFDTLVIETESDHKYYDGMPLINDNWSLLSGEIEPNHTLLVTVLGNITDCGTVPNDFEVKVLDSRGVDVTGSYKIIKKQGNLTVMKRKVTLSSLSAEKTYDGMPLSRDEFIIAPAYLAESAVFLPVITGSRTEIGTSPNTIESCSVLSLDGRDIYDNFEIEYNPGRLTVNTEPVVEPIKITVKTFSDEKVYDGTPLTKLDWEITEGELLDGHRAVVTVTGSITDKGSVDNTFGIVIKDDDGNSVSDQYEVKKVTGVLTVTPIYAAVLSGTAEKVYDGEPLVNSDFAVIPAYLEEDYEFSAVIIGSRTEEGSSPNVISSVTVIDKNGRDVSHNFNIEKRSGTLTVLPPEEEPKPVIVYKSDSASKQYDGIALSASNCWLESGELLPGHRAEISLPASITEVGRVDNEIIIKIIDENGEDVSEMYVIETVTGVLEVTPIKIALTTESDEKVYDGTPLVKHEYYIEPELPFALGHSLVITINGSQTSVGWSDNTVSLCQVFDSDGNDVTRFYSITKHLGTLTVLPVDSNDPVDPDPDNPQEPTPGRNPSGSTPIKGPSSVSSQTVYRVTSDKADSLYLKEMSYGNYNATKDGWDAAPVYTGRLPGGESPFFITAYALDNGGKKKISCRIEPLIDVFVLPYYSTGAIVNDSNDVIINGNASSEYVVNYYDWNSTAGIVLPSSYADDELLYREFVRENYLAIDDETKAFMDAIIAEKNFDASKASVISDVASYIKKSATYNLEYDRRLDDAENIVIEFLSRYKEGICQHYASAATLLFRALGIPARYTVGYVANVKAGVKTNVPLSNAHAWVEVYINGIGWVNVEVTGSSSSGKIALTVAAPTEESVYNGEPLYAPQTITGVGSLSDYGYTYEFEVEGVVAELGKAKSKVVEFRIYDSAGTLIYDKTGNIGKDKFDITYKEGDLHQYLSVLTFENDDHTKTYDGIAITVDPSECVLVSGMVYSGYTYEITKTASVYLAGQVINDFEVAVYKNGVDCTDHYKIVKNCGKIQINRRNITITAGSTSKPYDGEALVYNHVIYDEQLLANGDQVYKYTLSGSQTNVGKCSNVIREVIIRNNRGENVTSCYQIEIVDGLLTVVMP